MNSPTVQQISECFVKPQYELEESKQPIYFSPWDLSMLSLHYIQKGLLFIKPPSIMANQENSIHSLLERLKHTFSLALVHFYPLSGRLATLKQENSPTYSIFIDCQNSPGAKFIYATLDSTVSDILSPIYVPQVVQSFFDLNGVLNHDGDTMPLLSVQVTELIDGIFIGCSMNHITVDGTSFWHFFRVWSDIYNTKGFSYTPLTTPIHNRWFPKGRGPVINLPFTSRDQFISTSYEAPILNERIFHFSSESVKKLKAKANSECGTNKISSLQALGAFVWRCVTRVRRVRIDQETICKMAINNRSRLDPSLSEEYVGSYVQSVRGIATAGELLEHNLGWAAWLVNRAVINHTDKAAREWLESWLEAPFFSPLIRAFHPCSIFFGSSPRFNMYGNEFGLGRPVAIRSGCANKFDGRIILYPGSEGGGSIDLDVFLAPDTMSALESDVEFMEAAF